MKRISLLTLAALVSTWLSIDSPAAPLLPELVFKDTFDSATPSDDINADNAARQTGLLAPLTYAVGGNAPQLGQDGFAGVVKLNSDSLLSPNMNFTFGRSFTIEFDVNPGADDDPAVDGLSGDWCAVVFGASSQNVFVNGSDGIGILFRNNGDIQTFTGGTAVGGGPGIPGGLPRDRSFHVKLDVVTGGFNGSAASVQMSIDGTLAGIGAGGATTLTKADGFRNNYITLEGYGFPGPWVHTFDNLQISAIPDIQVAPVSISVNRAVSTVSEAVTVTIPAQLNATAPAQVKIISSNPSVAVPTGADGTGTLTLNFAAGAARSQTFTVNGVASGVASLRVEGPADVNVNSGVNVFVVSGIGMDELLFKDTFDVSEGSLDINFEINGPRQTGTAKGLAYSESANTAAGGPGDDFTSVNMPSYPGKLWIIDQGGGVSPMRNFNDGPEFYIEAEINPGANVTDQSSDNWSAIVFGTTQPNSFVISADGFGILFRNNGAIQVFDGGSAVYSSATGLLPMPPFKVRIDSKAVNFAGAPATISMKVNDQTMALTATSDSYVKAGGFRGNYVTLEGIGSGLDHVFDNFTVGAKSCITFRDGAFETTAGQTVSTTVQIPAAMTATAAATVTVRSSNPGVADATGAVGGILTIPFAIGQTTAPLNIAVTGAGSVQFELANSAGVCTGEPLVINSRIGLVRNPSFELNYNPGFPHYSDITAWEKTGGTGVNNSSGPFADNSTIPDLSQAAFLQGAASIKQVVNGLVPGKNYWIQFRYNARGCCGGTIDLATQVDGAEIDHLTDIKAQAPNEYGFRNVGFTAAGTSAELMFVTTAVGDATAVIDAVSITQRDDGNVVMENPSFEASGDIAGTGSLGIRRLAGWTGTGDIGINFGGSGFADNGKVPDQDHVLFLNGAGASVAQTAKRLTAASSYKLQWAYNAPAGKTPHLRVKVGGNVVWEQDVAPVLGSAVYRTASVDFVASGTTADIAFEQSSADQVVLLDNIQLLGQSITLPCLGISPAKTELSLNQSVTISVVVPPQLIAAGPATIKLKSANPAVAQLEGAAADGTLSINFAAGGDPRRDVTLNALALGRTTIDVLDAGGLCVDNGVNVAVISGFVRNPSFEANPVPGPPGYGSIDSWTGGSGLNNAIGPFHDNGQVPDRKQIGFLQGSGSLAQTLANLVPGKHYWVQFRYNIRNCCGNPAVGLVVRLNDVDLLTIDSIAPVLSPNEYNYGQAEFTADATTGVLSFNTVVSGDGTLLLDAVTVVQRDEGQIVLQNPSFEAEGNVPAPGYIQPDGISGWAATGNYGVNAANTGPFADNGVNPDQDSVAFIQGAGSLSQNITGLTAGSNYTLSFAVNARSGNAPRLRVSFAGAVILEEDITPVGAGNAYAVKSVAFTASNTDGVLKFEQIAAGDNTVLLDNIKLAAGGNVEIRPTVGVSIANGNTLQISWPTTATGFNLFASGTAGGTYTAVLDPVVVVGGNNVVTVPITGSERYFQLRK